MSFQEKGEIKHTPYHWPFLEVPGVIGPFTVLLTNYNWPAAQPIIPTLNEHASSKKIKMVASIVTNSMRDYGSNFLTS